MIKYINSNNQVIMEITKVKFNFEYDIIIGSYKFFSRIYVLISSVCEPNLNSQGEPIFGASHTIKTYVDHIDIDFEEETIAGDDFHNLDEIGNTVINTFNLGMELSDNELNLLIKDFKEISSEIKETIDRKYINIQYEPCPY